MPIYLKAVIAITAISAVMVVLGLLGGQSMDSARGYRRWRVTVRGARFTVAMLSLIYLVMRLRHHYPPAWFIGVSILLLAAFVLNRATRKPL